MDLAKIRKKYRLPLQQGTDAKASDDTLMPVQNMPVVSAETEPSDTVVSGHSGDIIAANAPQPPVADFIPAQNAVYRDPVKIILAGRDAAGCAEELADGDESSGDSADNFLEYLCFLVSSEIYGVNIMDIKEIIKPRKVTELPRSPEFVSGIISLRGTIIPIIDMRSRLGLPQESITGKERIVVIKNNQSFSGLSVDEVTQVVRISRESMEPAPSVLEGLYRDFVSGIGRSEGRCIIILNLESIADINLC